MDDDKLKPLLEQANADDVLVNAHGHFLYTVGLNDGTRSALRCKPKIAEDSPAAAFALQDILVLPASLVPICLRFYHIGNGHPGTNRTAHTISQRYWWKGRYDDISEYVCTCRPCKLRKADNFKAKPPVLRYPRSQRPFDLVHVDLTGPLPKSGPQGFEYILVVKDALTQWIELLPLTSKDSREVAHALFNNVYCRHGAVSVYVSDKGAEFVNGIHRVVNHLLQQHQTSTTP